MDSTMPKKHALIIGINTYLFLEPKFQLKGCVNDAEAIRKILIDKFKFEPSNIAHLLDKKATGYAIRREMELLADKVEKDDIVVFHFSGHGHQCRVKTEFTDEGSGKENSIIPCDDCEKGDDGKEIWREIRDHEFAEWLHLIAEKTPYTTLIFDSCYSGTMTRSSETTTDVRSLPAEARSLHRRAEPIVLSNVTTQGPENRKPGAGGWLSFNDNYVVISGCRDTQKSKETYFNQHGERVKHGVLSYYLTRALMHAKKGTTYRDAFESACAGVVSKVSAQNPQIEGMLDRELFGVKDIEPLAFIPITEVNADHVTLGAGMAHGLRSGSKWRIYPPGTKLEDPQESLGELVINHVGALSSTADIVERFGSIVSGARCVELEAVITPEPLHVDISQVKSEIRWTLEQAIRQSKLLAIAEVPEEAYLHARVIDSINELPENVSEQQKQHSEWPAWAFFEGEDELCMPLHAIREPNVSKILLSNLEKMASFKNLLQLDNPNTALKVEFNLFKRESDDTLILANGGTSEFAEHEPMVLELKNNETDRTVFFSILWLAANKEIIAFYPPRRASDELSPGKTVRIGDKTNKLTASFTKDYFADVGCESCKVMFTTKEADFSWLNQDRVRSETGPSSNLAAFDAAFTGSDNTGSSHAEGDEQAESNSQTIDDWNAITRSFILTRGVN
jgi:hypothetical protein